MKKISNNVSLGRLTQIFNVAILFFFILSVIFLLKFDKINVVKVETEPSYLKAKDHLHSVEHPLKQNQAEVEYYAYKLDTLKQHQASVVKDKKAVKKIQEDIDRTTNTLAEKKEALAQTEQAIADERASFEPVEAEYNDLLAQTDAARGTYNIFMCITIILFLLKVIIWAIWNFKNAKNLRNACSWMEKATNPAWAFWGWVIPVYNLIKPYSFFSELYDETEYVLVDKNVMAADNKSDNDFVLGFWWGSFLIAVCLMSLIMISTFFGDGASFYKLNHTTVAIAAIVLWIVYVLMEILVANKYNKMNKLMADNENKL